MTATGSIDLDCGIARERIEGWLRDELHLEQCGSYWLFPTAFGTCHISLTPLEPRVIAAFRLSRTRLFASGNDDALEIFNRVFTLRFMSAGG